MPIGSAHGDRLEPETLGGLSAERAATPPSQAEFAAAMALVGPFEAAAHLAVAVSGGPDSMALLLLMSDWVAARKGRITALTVDHGLRAESAAEADLVARWAEKRGIDHQILRWLGAKPSTGLQAQARKARYGLLFDWCKNNGVLHLALAHQFEDQQETIAMRRVHGSTAFGLAGMSGVAIQAGVRLIRPLLGMPKARLKSYLSEAGQPFIEDPSNQALRFERVRWRLGLHGDLPGRGEIVAAGHARAQLERMTNDWLTRSVKFDDAGYALLPPSALEAAAESVLLRGLGNLLLSIGGGEYAPGEDRLRRLLQHLKGGGPMHSLGGCLSGRWRRNILICREAAAASQILDFAPGSGNVAETWDRRFLVEVLDSSRPGRVACIGQAGLAELAKRHKDQLDYREIPAPARASLPALLGQSGAAPGVTSGEAILCVPHLGFGSGLKAAFRPTRPLTNCGFTVV